MNITLPKHIEKNQSKNPHPKRVNIGKFSFNNTASALFLKIQQKKETIRAIRNCKIAIVKLTPFDISTATNDVENMQHKLIGNSRIVLTLSILSGILLIYSFIKEYNIDIKTENMTEAMAGFSSNSKKMFILHIKKLCL